MSLVNARVWLQQNQEQIIERWLSIVNAQNLPTFDLLSQESTLLLQSVVHAVGRQELSIDEGIRAYAARCHQEQGGSPSVLSQIAAALRTAAMDVAFESNGPEQAIWVWQQVFPYLDLVDRAFSEAFAEIAEQERAEWHRESEQLNAELDQAKCAAEQALAQLRSIYDISEALSTSLFSEEDIFEKLAQKLGIALHADHCALWLSDVGALRIVARYGTAEPDLDGISEDDQESSLNAVLLSGTPQVLYWGQNAKPSDEKLMDGLGARTLLLAPLSVQEIPIGVVTVGRGDGAKGFDPNEVALVESVVRQAAIALQNAGLYEEISALNRSLEGRVASRTRELAREKDRNETLYAIGRALSTSLDLDKVLEKTLQLITRAVGAKHGSIMLLDQETGMLVYRARLSEMEPLSSDGEATPFKPGVGVAGWIIQHRQPVLIEDVLEDERWVEIHGRASATRSLIGVPLIVGEEIHGVLLLSDHEAGAFDESQLKLVAASAQQVAQATSNAQLYDRVRESATTMEQMFRREQEERTKSQAVLQSIADGVIVNDIHDRVIVFNTVAEEILDTKREDVLGKAVWHLFDAFEENGRNDAMAALKSIRTSPDAAAGQAVETTLETQNKVISVHMAPVLTESGESLGVVTALRDITREVQADRAKSEFVSTVSHELRTPLTSIKGYTDLLYAGAVGSINDQQKRFIGIIKNNAERLTALINDLLDISRIETGRVKLKIEPFELAEIVHEVVESLREQIEGKGLRLELDLSDGVGEIMGDRSRMVQIVTNLLSNSFKYTDEGWIRISLSLLEGAVRLDVADSGIGISTEDQNKIFERFYRADTPVMDGRGGTGLGLAITKQLIELHGGRVWVKSELGVGSTFTVVLPTTSQELPSSVLAELPAGAKKILVVDDERDILALLRHQLGARGYQVLTASTGGQAISKAMAEQPDLITLDVLLPDRHGFDVLRDLKARSETKNIPVVILSVVQDEANAYKLGAMDYIVKPLDEQRLLDCVSNILNRKGSVLVAEDTEDTAGLLIELLEKNGYETLLAENGYETLALARREQPELILLDLRMPGMDGYEALTRLKKDPETRMIPILIMSAHAADAVQERIRVRAMGAQEFLAKPFTLDRLLQEIERAINHVDEKESADRPHDDSANA